MRICEFISLRRVSYGFLLEQIYLIDKNNTYKDNLKSLKDGIEQFCINITYDTKHLHDV